MRWYSPDGKPKARTFAKQPQADAYTNEITERLGRGPYRGPATGKIAFATVAEAWFTSLHRPGRRPKADYRELLGLYLLPRWRAFRVDAIWWEDGADWVTELCSKPGARGKVLSPARIAET